MKILEIQRALPKNNRSGLQRVSFVLEARGQTTRLILAPSPSRDGIGKNRHATVVDKTTDELIESLSRLRFLKKQKKKTDSALDIVWMDC